jgi:hypothetical protein
LALLLEAAHVSGDSASHLAGSYFVGAPHLDLILLAEESRLLSIREIFSLHQQWRDWSVGGNVGE